MINSLCSENDRVVDSGVLRGSTLFNYFVSTKHHMSLRSSCS